VLVAAMIHLQGKSQNFYTVPHKQTILIFLVNHDNNIDVQLIMYNYTTKCLNIKKDAYFANVKIAGSSMNAKQTSFSVAGCETMCLRMQTCATYSNSMYIYQQLVHKHDQVTFGLAVVVLCT